MPEFHVTGPPGCGKTTYAAQQAARAVEKYGPDSVTITSLTRAAAREIAGRDTGVNPAQVGTLHSLCWRSIAEGRKILQTQAGLDSWNEFVMRSRAPSYRLDSGIISDGASGGGGRTPWGQKTYAGLELQRHRQAPQEHWRPSEVEMYDLLQKWAEAEGGIDFTGIIEEGLEALDVAPGDPRILIGDECQDWSRLELALFRQWAENAETSILIGDPDQAIFEWRGASPRVFMDFPVPDENRRVLSQSYRVPATVHDTAQQIIRRISEREDVAYHPRAHCGAVQRAFYRSWRDGLKASLDQSLDETEGRIMLIAACDYHLSATIEELREKGIPFFNPYAPGRSRYNPLGIGVRRPGTTSTSQRMLAFLTIRKSTGLWALEDLLRWIPLTKNLIKRGAKAELKNLEENYTVDDLARLFNHLEDLQRLIAAARACDPHELVCMANKASTRALFYPMRVVQRGGIAALRTPPRLVVGTIHSVKGGEADIVHLVAELPPKQAQNDDSTHRLYYVAATRARDQLIAHYSPQKFTRGAARNYTYAIPTPIHDHEDIAQAAPAPIEIIEEPDREAEVADDFFEKPADPFAW
jgi:hypothetical protein